MQSSPSADPNHRTNQNLERAKRASNAQKAFEVRLANRFAKQNFHREFESTGSSLVEDKTRNAKLRSDYYPPSSLLSKRPTDRRGKRRRFSIFNGP